MQNQLIYLDQNVIGLQQEGKLGLRKSDDYIWVFSKEHFAEIKRSKDPTQYIEVLDQLDAKLLALKLDENWKITDQTEVSWDKTPGQCFDEYLEATGDVDFDETIFDPLQVWLNGGGDEGPLRDLPDKLAAQIIDILKADPILAANELSRLEESRKKYDAMTDELVDKGNDIAQVRTAFGDSKGRIGSLSGDNVLEQIWSIVSPACKNVGINQFFGFEPIDNMGYQKWPVYLGIVGCCSVLDILGFQAEKKCRKVEKIANVRSDSGHIAMGAFCTAILTGDKRLLKRAKAIYEFKKIGTKPLLIEQKQG